MLRLLAAIVLIRLLAQSVGVGLALADTCVEPCEDESGGDEGGCEPECQDCLCCAHHRVVTLPPPLTLVPALAGSTVELPVEVFLGVFRVDEIMKVPKASIGA